MKIKLIFILFFLFFFFPLNEVSAIYTPKVDVYRLTSGFYREDWPAIYKDKILWIAEGIIYVYDVKEKTTHPLFEGEQPLTNLFGLIAYNGRYIVYNSYDGVSYNVHVYDVKRRKDIAITEGTGSKWATDYDDKVVVYVEGGACGKLYAYNIITSERRLITEQVCGTANISQRFIVWGYSVVNGSGIFGYDLRTGTKYDIATGPGYRSSPDIFDNKIIWSINNNDSAEVYIYDLRTKKESLLYKSSNYWISWPSISKRYAVWGKNTAQHVSGVEGVHLKTGVVFEIQEQGPHQNDNLSAIIKGNIVAWMAWRTGNGDIYGAIIGH